MNTMRINNSPSTSTKTHHGSTGALARIAAAMLLALTLVVALGIRPAAAQTTSFVDAFNNPAEAGGIVDLYGGGFQPGEFVSVEFGGWTIASATADQSGDWWATGTIDASMPEGGHPLDANGDLGSWASMELTVVVPAAPAPPQLFPFVGPLAAVEPGGIVDIVGGDFQPFEVVTVEFGGLVLDVVSADANGEFFTAGLVDPLMPPGFHPLDASGDLGTFAGNSIEVLQPAYVPPALYSWGPAPQGTSAIVDGDGFQPFESVWIEFGGLSTPVVADQWGFFQALVWIPEDMPVGAHPLEAHGDLGSYADIHQNVDPAIVVTPHAPNQTPAPGTVTPTPPQQAAPKPPATGTPDDSDTSDDTGTEDESEDSDEFVLVLPNLPTTVDTDADGEPVEVAVTTETVETADTTTEAGPAEVAAPAQVVQTRTVQVDDGGISPLLAILAGLSLAGATAGSVAMLTRRQEARRI